MSKGKIKLLFAILFSAVLSFFILYIVFQESFCVLTKEVLLSIFTGSLFALPSYIILIYTNYSKSINIKFRLLNNLLKSLKKFPLNVNANYNIDKNEECRKLMINHYEQLLDFFNDNYLISGDDFDDLLKDVFTLSTTIKTLNKDLEEKKIEANELNIRLKNILSLRNDCVEKIKLLLMS